MVTITLNGDPHSIKEGTNLLSLVESLGLNPERVAIELNRKIIKRPLWQDTQVEAGAEIEVVQFVGGGSR
jgi:thiamine biosynthesis protein ThiS